MSRPQTKPECSRVFIVGASARAAAHSAVRAGMQPMCADLFIDEDLLEIAEVAAIENYPEDILRVSQSFPSGPWMYTGAMENYPRMIEAVSQERPLWGNPANVVKLARDPLAIHRVLKAAELPAAEVRLSSNQPPPDGDWMLKPRQSGGGRGIEVWNKNNFTSKTLDEEHYFQRRVEGQSHSALFLAARERTSLIGIARQFVGMAALNAPRWGYCGSIGPIRLDEAIEEQTLRTGEVIAKQCGLRGLFGIDLICDAAAAWMIEVNPRYTASVELFEHAFDLPLLEEQRRACASIDPRDTEDTSTRTWAWHPSDPKCLVAKAILFSPEEVTIRDLTPLRTKRAIREIPLIADVPRAGSTIPTGRPVCTILATGETKEDCARDLSERISIVSEHIFGQAININVSDLVIS